MIASQPHRDAGRREIRLRLGDAVKAEMEDRGGEHGGGVAVADAGDEVAERADAAGGDDGDRYRGRHRACQVYIEARFGAVAVHRGQQDLAAALAVVEPRLLDGIAGIDEIDEVDALDDAAVLDVETGDQALLQHARFSACPGASPRSRASAARGAMRPS